VNLKRLVGIALVTTLLCLLAAAVLWRVHIARTYVGAMGGPGTDLVEPGHFAGETFDMLGDPRVASTPLVELLPDDWKRSERRVLIHKSERILTVFSGESLVKSYFVALGRHPIGAKTRRNDGRTPEGEYYVCTRNPQSRYQLSVRISYPGVQEAEQGIRSRIIDRDTHDRVVKAISRRKMPPQDTELGSAICIHNGGVGMVANDFSKAAIVDWTDGCIAMRKEDMREVYDFAVIGTAVVILP